MILAPWQASPYNSTILRDSHPFHMIRLALWWKSRQVWGYVADRVTPNQDCLRSFSLLAHVLGTSLYSRRWSDLYNYAWVRQSPLTRPTPPAYASDLATAHASMFSFSPYSWDLQVAETWFSAQIKYVSMPFPLSLMGTRWAMQATLQPHH